MRPRYIASSTTVMKVTLTTYTLEVKNGITAVSSSSATSTSAAGIILLRIAFYPRRSGSRPGILGQILVYRHRRGATLGAADGQTK